MWHGFQALATPKATGNIKLSYGVITSKRECRESATGATVQTRRALGAAPASRPPCYQIPTLRGYDTLRNAFSRASKSNAKTSAPRERSRRRRCAAVGLREWRLGFGRRSSRHMDQDLVLSVPSTR